MFSGGIYVKPKFFFFLRNKNRLCAYSEVSTLREVSIKDQNLYMRISPLKTDFFNYHQVPNSEREKEIIIQLERGDGGVKRHKRGEKPN